MRLNISNIAGRKGASFQVKRELPASFEEARGPINVELQVTNTGDGFLVTGDLTLAVELSCSRCLKPITMTLETSIEEEFLHNPRVDDDEDFWGEQPLVDGNEIDTTSLIEESLLVSIPMKPVCQEDCPGLCPGCGALLALGDCTCPDPTIDVRLAPLSELLQQMSETTTSERRKDHGSSKEKTFKSKS